VREIERKGRVIVANVRPEVDCGRFAVKRTVGEPVTVDADVYADGHDAVSCVLLYRREGSSEFREARMKPLPNDHWRGSSSSANWAFTTSRWKGGSTISKPGGAI
jgi:starch synthase (maltosyl-transferring)